MAVVGTNATVKRELEAANYGFVHEVVGDVRLDANGHWRINGVPMDATMSALCKGFNGTAAVQIIVVPIVSSFVVADNTLVQADMPLHTA
jgi:hypothetical protein